LAASVRNKQARQESIRQLLHEGHQASVNSNFLPLAGGWLRSHINTIPKTGFSKLGLKLQEELQKGCIKELQDTSTHLGSYLLHFINTYSKPSNEALKHLDTMATVYLKQNFGVIIEISPEEVKEEALTPLLLLEILIKNEEHQWTILERLTCIQFITVNSNQKIKE
jgi:hypothetical protein